MAAKAAAEPFPQVPVPKAAYETFELDPKVDWLTTNLAQSSSAWFPVFETDLVEAEYHRFCYHDAFVFIMVVVIFGLISSTASTIILPNTVSGKSDIALPAACVLAVTFLLHLILMFVLSAHRMQSSALPASQLRDLTKRIHWLFVIMSCIRIPLYATLESQFPLFGCITENADDCTRTVPSLHAAIVAAMAYCIRNSRHAVALLVLFQIAVSIAFLSTNIRPRSDDAVVLWVMFVVSVSCGIANYYRDIATRGYFKAILRMAVNRLQVSTQRNRIALIVRSAVPARLARRLAKAATTMIPFGALGDHAELGTVCVTAATDFEKWSTSLLLTQIVSALHHLYTIFDAATDVYGVDRAGTYGDTYVVTAGVVRNTPATAAHAAFFGLWQQQLREASIVALKSFVATGEVSGGVVGGVTIRYVLYGQALDVALAALPVATSGQVWCTQSTIDELARVSPGKFCAREEVAEAGLFSIGAARSVTGSASSSATSSMEMSGRKAAASNSNTQQWLARTTRSGRRTSSSSSNGAWIVGVAPDTENSTEAHFSASASGTNSTELVNNMVDFARFAVAFRLEADSVAAEEQESWQVARRPVMHSVRGLFVDAQDEAMYQEFTATFVRRHATRTFFIGGMLAVGFLTAISLERLLDSSDSDGSAPPYEAAAVAVILSCVIGNILGGILSAGTLKSCKPPLLAYAFIFGFLASLIMVPEFLLRHSVMSGDPFFACLAVVHHVGILTRFLSWYSSFAVSLILFVAPTTAAAFWKGNMREHINVFGSVACTLAALACAWDGSVGSRRRFGFATQAQSEATAVGHAVTLLRQLVSCVLPPHVVNLAVHATEIDLQRSEYSGEVMLPAAERLLAAHAIVHYTQPTDRLADCVVMRVELAPLVRAADCDVGVGGGDERFFRRWASVGDMLSAASMGVLQQIETLGDSILVAGPLVPDLESDGVARACVAAVTFLAALRLRLGLNFTAVATLDEAYGALLGRGAMRYCLFGVAVRHSAALLRAAEKSPNGAVAYLTRSFINWLFDDANRYQRPPPWPLPQGLATPQRWMVRSVGLRYVWPLHFDAPSTTTM